MIVYMIANRTSGKCYIGKTTATLKARWRQHRTEARIGRIDSPLYRDMRMMGIESFVVAELAATNSQRRLSQLERKFIRNFGATNELYNLDNHSHGGKPRRAAGITRRALPKTHRDRIAASLRSYYEQRKAAQ